MFADGTPAPIEDLAAAVRAGDTARVALVLDRHPELRSRLDDPLPGVPFGATALLVAVQQRRRGLIDLLLSAGADVNRKSHWWAGGFGVLDDDGGLASFLIERGAVVDVHAASRLGMLERLAELLAADPGLVHARGGDGQTPLHVAPTVAVAAYLLDHGADVDARDVDHESTPAQYMVADRQDVARYLVSRGCRSDILMAAALGDRELVRRHLDAEPASIRFSVSEEHFPRRDPRAGGTIYVYTLGWHKTPHLLAREYGHEDVLRLLIERSPPGLQLAVACELGDAAATADVLRALPDLARAFGDHDRRRLAHAAQHNNTAGVRLMLAAGWPVDVRGQHGATPLHWAAWHGNVAMVEEILRRDPPMEIADSDHNGTPLAWALHGSVHGWHRATGDYGGTVEALLAAGARAPEPSADDAASEAVRGVLRRWRAAGRQGP